MFPCLVKSKKKTRIRNMGNNKINFKPSSWLALGCITLLQALSSTRSVFSACSSLMKNHYHISHAQLNNFIVASETGRLFGCVSSAAADYFPPWLILFIGLVFGSIGYGLQYFCTAYKIHSLSYWQALLLNILAGNSSCWIDTYCDLLARRNFKDRHSTVIEITSTYSGLSGKIYSALVEGIQGRKCSGNCTTHLLLTCLAPAATGLIVALVNTGLEFMESGDMDVFPTVFVIAIAPGVYEVIESVAPAFRLVSSQLRAVILLLVVMIPFATALFITAADRFAAVTSHSQVMPKVSQDSCQSKSERITKELKIAISKESEVVEEQFSLGNQHELKKLLMNVDFWMFYLVNAFGATLGMVYLNNLERITKSRSTGEASFLLEISFAFGFFGRIFAVMFCWYTREKTIIPNPALAVLLMIPMPIAMFMLVDSNRCLYISTGILGTCSGALNAINSLITSELFGCKNSVLIQTVVLTNVPLGYLLLGYLAALNYEKEGAGDQGLCMGLQCYHKTFLIWGSISFIGTILSFILHLRTQKYYLQKSYIN